MANQQLSCADETQHIKPKDFDITWGSDCRYWRLPNACDPTAQLIKVCWLEIKAKANIDPSKRNRLRISFDVSPTCGYSGFKNADVRIGAKVGADGAYQYKCISLDGMKLNECKTVYADFDFAEDPCACDKTLHFGLFDTWAGNWKSGMKFHGACVSPIQLTQHIKPKDFDITWGNDCRYWRLPNACDPTAQLIEVCWLEVKAKANIDPCRRNRLRISFDVSATCGYSGFKNADVRIGAKIGAEGAYQYKCISLDGMKLNECKTVYADFEFAEDPCACDKTLHFGLFDTWTGHWKRGMKFHGACVAEPIGPYCPN